MPRRNPKRTRSPANNHPRYGGRGTRTNSKVNSGAVRLQRLESLLEQARKDEG